MDEMKTCELLTFGGSRLSVGRLGASVKESADTTAMLIAGLDMAERRILRLEMALRRAGIEIEAVELPS